VFYEFYEDINDLKTRLQSENEQIQCIVVTLIETALTLDKPIKLWSTQITSILFRFVNNIVEICLIEVSELFSTNSYYCRVNFNFWT
jgi:hypothetical protein